MKRLKILLSAYACEPHRGSEPGIGWNTATELAKHHEVWVLTSSYHRPHIERDLKAFPRTNLTFIHLDVLETFRPVIGEEGIFLQVHYYLWQIAAYFVALKWHRRVGFDLAHHISYVRCWSPSFISLLPIPFVWGPVAGNEGSPYGFMGTYGLRGALFELFRKAVITAGKLDPFVRLTARRSAVAYAASEETAVYLRQLGARKIEYLSATVTPEDAFRREPNVHAQNSAVTFISIGRLLHWKGFHLALRALSESGLTDADYHIVGSGAQERRLRRLAQHYGVAHQVSFLEISRDEMFSLLDRADILLHPAIHDPGPTVIVEAMAARKPFICLDVGSPEVTGETGIVVPMTTLEDTVQALAGAMRRLATDVTLRKSLGDAGRQKVDTELNWSARGQRYSELYQKLAARQIRSTKRAEVG